MPTVDQGGSGETGHAQSDINVTPLVDVCLVLLIIFMVVTPMLQKGKAVQLPMTTNPGQKPETEDQVLVTIDETGSIWVEADQMPSQDQENHFIARMSEESERGVGGGIVIKADKRLEFGQVKDVMVLLQKSGFDSVGLITEKPQGQPAPQH